MIKKTNLVQFDFLDFGASKPESIQLGVDRFFGKKGLGIDLDPKRVEIMNRAGLNCMVGDISKLDVPSKSVKFVKMSHILEHMPDLKGVEAAMKSAKKVATDFLVITGPFFDQDTYLKKQGLKLDWSDYPEHTCHLTVKQLTSILKKLNLGDYELYLRNIIKDSSSERIHPLGSPAGSHNYDKNIHPPKPNVVFEEKVWTDFVCYVKLKKDVPHWNQITRAYNNQIPYIFSTNSLKTKTPDFALDSMISMDESIKKYSQALKKQKQHTADEHKRTLKIKSPIRRHAARVKYVVLRKKGKLK